jgi:hypothetical protein
VDIVPAEILSSKKISWIFLRIFLAIHNDVLPQLADKYWILSDSNPARALAAVFYKIITEFVPGHHPLRTNAMSYASTNCTARRTIVKISHK